jgi:hypothetical protein
MKKIILIVMVILMMTPLAVKTKNIIKTEKSIVVDYVVDENGKPNVVYIQNNASPKKLVKIINNIESMKFMNADASNNVYSVTIKI